MNPSVTTKSKKTKSQKASEAMVLDLKDKKYIEAIGRRKEAVARVRFYEGNPSIIINSKKLEEYFPILEHQNKVLEPFIKTGIENKHLISIQVKGGGITGQAEAIRLGISRILAKLYENLKPVLRNYGLLTRDARVVERKKYGFKKARKRPQWAKDKFKSAKIGAFKLIRNNYYFSFFRVENLFKHRVKINSWLYLFVYFAKLAG